jgi:hypothetical protein
VHLKAALKGLLYVGVSALALLSVAIAGVFAWLQWQLHLPSDQEARGQFHSHRTEYIRFASLLQLEPRPGIIGSDGTATTVNHERPAAEYRDLMRKIGAKDVVVGEDGSIEFALWGFGCAICSDSYKGVRYVPEESKPDIHRGWVPQLVNSLDSNKLPKANGSVTDGLYVVPIEPGWFIYRLEIHE